MDYYCLAFYKYIPLHNPHEEIRQQKAYLEQLDAKSRIYINHEGINGQMSLRKDHALKYIDWMHSKEEFEDVHFKLHEWHEHAFPKLTIKYRKQLVALDKWVDLNNRGTHLPPAEFKKALEGDEPYVLVDVRNDYEWKVGHFEGARLPPCETYREFNHYAENLKDEVDPKNTKVLMYCTGGIRCETYSSLLKEAGFDKVFQLEGGIINYGLKEGSQHWRGKLFVFDDRLSVPLSEEKSEIVGKCHFCEAPTESYYNCANMDCNCLFLCCTDCLKKNLGTCQDTCMNAERLRPYSEQNPHKPFRKAHNYFSKK